MSKSTRKQGTPSKSKTIPQPKRTSNGNARSVPTTKTPQK